MISNGVRIGHRIQGLARGLLGKEETGSLGSHLARGAVGTLGLRVASSGLLLVISLILARLLGAEGFGAYAYAMAWVALLGVPSLMGLDRLLVRNVAAYRVKSAWRPMAGLLRWSNRTALLMSVGLAFLAGVISWALATHLDRQMLYAFWVVLVLLPVVTLTQLRQAAMQGLRRVVMGQVPEMLIHPLLFIGLIGGAYLVFASGLNPALAVGMNAMAAGVAFLIGVRLLHHALPQAVKEASPEYETRTWLKSALPLLFVGAVGVIHFRTDSIMLGAIKGAEAVGIYAVANRGVEFVLLPVRAVLLSLAPIMVTLYTTGQIARLQRIVTNAVRVILISALPLAVGLMVFGHWFLWLFGPEYTQGRMALSILSGGQLISVGMGSALVLLIMTGHERPAAIAVGTSAVLNIALNATLIPKWGVEGAASATAISMVLSSFLAVIVVYRRLGIHSTALGVVRLRRGT